MSLPFFIIVLGKALEKISEKPMEPRVCGRFTLFDLYHLHYVGKV